MESKNWKLITYFFILIFLNSCLFFESGEEIKHIAGKYWIMKNLDDPSSGMSLIKKENKKSNINEVIGYNCIELYFNSSKILGKFSRCK